MGWLWLKGCQSPAGAPLPLLTLSIAPCPLVPPAQGRGGGGRRKKKEAGKEGPRQPEQGESGAGPGVLGQDGCGGRIGAAGALGWTASHPCFSPAPLSPALRFPPPTTHTSKLHPPSFPRPPPTSSFPLSWAQKDVGVSELRVGEGVCVCGGTGQNLSLNSARPRSALSPSLS